MSVSMSTNSLVLKLPLETHLHFPESARYYAKPVTVCLWLAIGFINAAYTDISPHATGISITINTADALGMLIANLLLIRGLEHSNQLLVMPWLATSAWSMYNCHYRSIRKIVHVLHVTKITKTLPWIAIGLDCIALGLRALLTFRIMKLMINQWYQKKLRMELRETQ